MVDKNPSQSDDQEADASGPWGLDWRWHSLIVVRLAPTAARPPAQNLPLLLAPNQHGLAILEELDTEVESIWIVRPPETSSGPLITEVVDHVFRWSVLPASPGHLCALHCESGAVFVADSECLYQVEDRGTLWSTGSKYKKSNPAAN